MTPVAFAPNPFDAASTITAVYKTLDEAQAAIPDGHTHAIIFKVDDMKTDGPSGSFTFSQKAGDGWDVLADVAYDKPHGVSAGFMVAKSWS